MQHIPDDADNRKPSWWSAARAETQALADGILTGPITASCGLVDHEHDGSAVAVTFCELSALKHRDAHRPKIVDAHDATISDGSILVRLSRATFDRKGTTPVNAT